jgi:hypothetical protein
MMPYWVVRSRSVTMAEAQPTPKIRSPSPMAGVKFGLS